MSPNPPSTTTTTTLPPPFLTKILHQARTIASHSWEHSTIFYTLLEHSTPQLSIFNSPFPDNEIPTWEEEDVEALRYIKPFIRVDGDTLSEAREGDNAAGDPPSLGIPALHLTPTHLTAATRQLHTLLDPTRVPRYSNGAISHITPRAELWADFVYMAPPFLAYYSVFTKDIGMLKFAAEQCRLYGEGMRMENGTWKHIVGEERNDGLWCTSNGWAGAGMVRVLATMRKSRFDEETREEQKKLVDLVRRILDGCIGLDTHASELLRNYLDDETSFGEVAGTALVAATVFRLAVLEPDVCGERYTAWAVRKMAVVESNIDRETGIVAPVCNPLKPQERDPLLGVSPEAQCFVVLMYAAYRDWSSKPNTGVSILLQ